jgi:hypothetical protein
MSEWIKKYSIFINAGILIVISIIGFNFRQVLAQVERKADTEIVDQKFKTVDIRIDNNTHEILENKQEIKDVKKDFLEEIRLLRTDLKLKEDKR